MVSPRIPQTGFPGENTYIRIYACMEKYTTQHYVLHITTYMVPRIHARADAQNKYMEWLYYCRTMYLNTCQQQYDVLV